MEIVESTILWWGYQHISGTYQAKRYFDKQDVQEAYESPFVKNVVGPFKAKDRIDAIEIIKNECK